MTENRKPVFDAVRKIIADRALIPLPVRFTVPEVGVLDRGIDEMISTLDRKAVDEARLAETLRSLFGPMTQPQWDAVKAVLDGQPEPAPSPEGTTQVGLTAEDFRKASARLACSVPQIRAVDEVESGGGWFTDARADILALDGDGGFIDGPNLPKILFESAQFDKRTNGKFRQSHPNLSTARWDRSTYVGGQGEWVRLHKAMQLDRQAALLSASVGRYQIMGFNHRAAGFATVEAFWDAMKTSERAHLEAFVSFVIASGLGDELRVVSNSPETCRAFARGYNGTGYAANNYHVKIANAHKRFAAQG